MKNVTAALVNAGVFGGSNFVVPAKSRWLSTAEVLGGAGRDSGGGPILQFSDT